MNKDIEDVFTRGLLEGFIGGTKLGREVTHDVTFTTSFLEVPSGKYFDRWTKGGGQEVVTVGEETYTRVYAGKVTEECTLSALGIAKKDIVGEHGVLTYFLKKLGSQTRLLEDVAATDGKFGYHYKVIEKELGGEVVLSKEWIDYDDTVVFVHFFAISPVK